MIYREFNKLKFKRTYIGGSKQNELKIFNDVQGTMEDNSDCNLFEFRKLLIQYLDDILNIILSWKYVLGLFSIIFIIIAVLVSIINLYISISILSLSLIFQLISQYLKYLERKKISEYDFMFDILLPEIKKQTGFNFNKN